MRYEIKPSHLASPVFLTPPGESSGAFPPLAVVLACLIFTDWVAKISGFLASVYLFRFRDSYLHPHQAEREESGDVLSRLNLGENVLLRTRSNKEMTSQLLFRVQQ
jgi:hypothetical protein